MSVGELQKYLADTVLKLKEFEQRWDYPESQTFDAPPEGPDGKQDPDQIKRLSGTGKKTKQRERVETSQACRSI